MGYIEKVAPIAQKYARNLLPSVTIAQAILESAWGESGLAKIYNNHFGIKASSSWKGKVTQQKTQEDDGSGKLYNITAGFKWYDSIDDSFKDHEAMFDTTFSKSHYAKVLSATTAEGQAQALQGTYATDTSYASKLINLINQYDLKKYDTKKSSGVSASKVISEALKYLGVNESNWQFKEIIDYYNANRNKSSSATARGYAVKYTDDWCDVFVSYVALKAGASALIDIECGVERHVEIFKNKGIWQEDGRITPRAGDIIVYDWNDGTQPNDGWADHIGYVEKVVGSQIVAIEGNKGEVVARRNIPIGWGYIRGFAQPKYGSGSNVTPAPVTPSKPTTTGNAKIRTFQSWLNKTYGFKIATDGFYGGPETKKAIVKAFQTELRRQYGRNIAVDGSYGPASKKASPNNIYVGMSGNITRIIQGTLICKGYDPKGFDGSFGPGCKAAVVKFQKDHKLVANGYVGKNTFEQLFK